VSTVHDTVSVEERSAAGATRAAHEGLGAARRAHDRARLEYERRCGLLYAGTGTETDVAAAEAVLDRAAAEVRRAEAALEYWRAYGPQRPLGIGLG
jgi:multidrug resistance efflux pump